MKNSTSKELIPVIIGVLILTCPFLGVLYIEGKPRFTLSSVLFEFSIFGWLWAILGSCSLVFTCTAALKLLRGDLHKSGIYRKLSIMSANATLAISLFIAALFYSFGHLICERPPVIHGMSSVGEIHQFCLLVVILGSAVSLAVYVVCVVLTLFSYLKHSTELTPNI